NQFSPESASGSLRAVFLLNRGAAGVLIGSTAPFLMKILWVKAGGLVPPDIGGKIRSYSILKELSKTHEVTLFTFYAAHSNDVHSGLNGMFDQVVNLSLPIPTNRGLGELASFVKNVFSSWPH